MSEKLELSMLVLPMYWEHKIQNKKGYESGEKRGSQKEVSI